MRAIAVLFVIAALGACHHGAQLSQRRSLGKATPNALETTAPWEKDPRVMKVRVWVDEDFRAQNLRWKAHLEEQLDEVNQFMVPALGVRLEVTSYKPWEARSTNSSLLELLDSLEAMDPGADTGWVIGYVSSLSTVSSTFDQIGMARPLGRHVIVRGYADGDERKMFTNAFPDTSVSERETVHQARRRHKQVVVLIHELVHTLGGIHEIDPGWLMHAAYNIEMRMLSDRCRELAQIVLDERLKPETEQNIRELASRLVGYLDANQWGGWDDAEKQQMLVYLRATMDTAAATGGGGAVTAPDIPIPTAAYDQFKRAQRLAAQGKSAEALAELEALIAAYPSTAEIRQAVCEVHIGATGPGSDPAIEKCTRAAEISPEDPRPFLARIEAFVRTGDRAHAIELLPEIEKRAGERAPVWDRVAEIYQATGRISQAEAAARRSAAINKSDTHPVLEWAGRTRARYGLPPDAKRWKIAPADEGAYVAAVRELLDLIYAGKTGEAQAKARAAEKRWKGAPGILGARCDLHLRTNDRGAAKKLCAQAIAAWKGAAWAQYLEGVMAMQDHKEARAVVSLRAAIAADPELAQAYRALSKALVKTKDDAGWQTLATEYQRRFGQPLPK